MWYRYRQLSSSETKDYDNDLMLRTAPEGALPRPFHLLWNQLSSPEPGWSAELGSTKHNGDIDLGHCGSLPDCLGSCYSDFRTSCLD
jgi:hypothetical protein